MLKHLNYKVFLGEMKILREEHSKMKKTTSAKISNAFKPLEINYISSLIISKLETLSLFQYLTHGWCGLYKNNMKWNNEATHVLNPVWDTPTPWWFSVKQKIGTPHVSDRYKHLPLLENLVIF